MEVIGYIKKSVKMQVYKNTISFMDQLADHDIKNIDNTIQDKQEYLHNLVQASASAA